MEAYSDFVEELVNAGVKQHADLVAFFLFYKNQPGFSEKAFEKLLNDTNEEVVLKILARYRETLKEMQATVRESLRDDDSDRVWKICHKVSGTATLLGFERFGNGNRNLSSSLQDTLKLSHDQKIELVGLLRDCEKQIEDLNVVCPNLSQFL